MRRPTSWQQLKENPLILPIFLPSLFWAISQGLLLPTLPLFARSFDISYGLVGLILAGESLGMLLGDIPSGMLLRYFGRKRLMLLGLAAMGLFSLAMAWSSSVPEILSYRLLAGIGRALYSVSRHSYLTNNVTLASRGRAIALFGGVHRIGNFAGPALGGLVAASLGLRSPFVLYAIFAATAVLIVAIFLQRDPAHPPTGVAHGHSHLWQTLRENYHTLLTAGIGQIFAQTIRAGRKVILPLYGAEILGLDVQSIGFILSISSGIDMSLFYPAGLIMDKFGRRFAIVPSFLLQALGMALVPFSGGYLTLLLAASLIGFGNGLGSGTMMTLGADLAPTNTQGEFLGVWRLIGDAGFAGGPLVVGNVADLLTLAPGAWVLAGIGFGAATMFYFFVPETLHKPTQAV